MWSKLKNTLVVTISSIVISLGVILIGVICVVLSISIIPVLSFILGVHQ
jgi:hypothetical protein